MKRVITAVTILVIIAVLCVVSLWATFQLTREMGDSLRLAAQFAREGDTERAKIAAEKAMAQWDFAGPVLSLYIYHDGLERFSVDTGMLPVYLERGAIEEFITTCESEQLALGQLFEGECPLLRNIF